MTPAEPIRIRPCAPADFEATLALFTASVRRVAARDYTEEQITAWAPDPPDRASWTRRRADRPTWVAEIGDAIVGVTELEQAGHLDMMYVHPDHQGRGVASTLLGHVESVARARGLEWLRTEASITARPFFLRRGFQVIAAQLVTVRGQKLLNYRMVKPIACAPTLVAFELRSEDALSAPQS